MPQETHRSASRCREGAEGRGEAEGEGNWQGTNSDSPSMEPLPPPYEACYIYHETPELEGAVRATASTYKGVWYRVAVLT